MAAESLWKALTIIEVPKRASLVDQVAEILRRGLRSGEWADGLPPERALCDRLQVSRRTLRTALDALQRAGLVRLASNRRRRVPVRKKKVSAFADPQLIAFLSPESLYTIGPSALYIVDELRRHLQEAGFQLEFVSDPRLKGGAPFKVLEGLVHQVKARCWILHWANAHVQRWFSERQLRVLVKGSCQEGVRFPSLDTDHRAASRHAVGVFFRLGHRRLALVVPNRGLQGDLAREAGFLEAFQTARHEGAVPLILRHDGTLQSLHSELRRCFHSESPPTGVLVSHAEQVLSVMTHLMNSGLRLPKDVSLISSQDEWFLDRITPTAARYRVDWGTYAARLSRMAVQLASTGVLACRPVRIMPQFLPGDSLAALG